ncbi:class E sortase [Streptomyces ochraceiscleroticus]|uniref:Class E sortase n=1 Tax=Streptomyces ochraceiscleroticus TaxID=47761 RepID=A0ABW1MPJ8_9ACTN|nr:class E sortase [Streptomyces ochraceiscleroticus]
MTALRPEREGTSSYGPHDPYDGSAAFEAAVGELGDPLTDPLPGRNQHEHQQYYDQPQYEDPAAGYEPTATYLQVPSYEPTAAYPQVPAYEQAGTYAYAQEDPGAYSEAALASAETLIAPAVPYLPADDETVTPRQDDETMALRQADAKAVKRPEDAVSRETETPAPGGRAARRRAAQAAAKQGGKRARRAAPAAEAARRGGKRARRPAPAANAAETAKAAETAPESAPTSRVAARRAARARKESVGVVVSRVTGEAFITLGVLMLLFVAYQLWWTNVLAHNQAGGAASNLQQEWDKDGADKRAAGAFSPGQGFAIMYIPKLDVKVPIAEGISKTGVLDHGMVGHYGEGKLKTAMPWDKTGNFAVAGHRNTHGEPFRYINRLVKGDKIVVETRSRFYTYEMESILPQTSPSNIGVIGPIPPGSGFTEPGRYLTLTTCTPEFTSTYRMIVWGKMVEERPRSKGKPDALVS